MRRIKFIGFLLFLTISTYAQNAIKSSMINPPIKDGLMQFNFVGRSNQLISNKYPIWTDIVNSWHIADTTTFTYFPMLPSVAMPYGVLYSQNNQVSMSVFDYGHSDAVIEIQFERVMEIGGSNPLGIILRYRDVNNYLKLCWSQVLKLDKCVNGTTTNLYIAYPRDINSASPTTGLSYSKFHRMQVVIIGNLYKVYFPEYHAKSVITTVDTFCNKQTKFGLYGKFLSSNSVNPIYNLYHDYVKYFEIYKPTPIPYGVNFNPGVVFTPLRVKKMTTTVNPFVVYSPSFYQVFSRDLGFIYISGKYSKPNYQIEYNFKGGSYITVTTNNNGTFSAKLSGQTGQGHVVIRDKTYPTIVDTIKYVGLGDVFIIAGQSNATGRGDHNQAYTHATLKAAIFSGAYLWGELRDPTHDPTDWVDFRSFSFGSGSYWPLLADSLLKRLNYPVAFTSCSLDGIAIEQSKPGSDHMDLNTTYGAMIYRAKHLGTQVKAVLWHQGESNAIITAPTTYTSYKTDLKTIADAIYADLGCPMICARINYCTSGAWPENQASVDMVNSAITDAASENSHILLGPNFNSPTNFTTGLHFDTDALLLSAGNMWWTAINAALYHL